jgi:hypothetical protein
MSATGILLSKSLQANDRTVEYANSVPTEKTRREERVLSQETDATAAAPLEQILGEENGMKTENQSKAEVRRTNLEEQEKVASVHQNLEHSVTTSSKPTKNTSTASPSRDNLPHTGVLLMHQQNSTMEDVWKEWLGDSVLNITPSISKDSDSRIGRGGHAEVFKGLMEQMGAIVPVALKRPILTRYEIRRDSMVVCRRFHLRLRTQVFSNLLQAILKEIKLCQSVSHDRILSFLGICYIGDRVHLVSPYMTNGNLSEYIKNHPGMDRMEAVGLPVSTTGMVLTLCAAGSNCRRDGLLTLSEDCARRPQGQKHIGRGRQEGEDQ